MARASKRPRSGTDRRLLAFGLFALAAFLPIFALVTNRPFGTTFLSVSVAAITAAGAAISGAGEGDNDDSANKQLRRKASRILKRVQAVVDETDAADRPPRDGPRLRARFHQQLAFGGRR